MEEKLGRRKSGKEVWGECTVGVAHRVDEKIGQDKL
jgi:hypothetical protein